MGSIIALRHPERMNPLKEQQRTDPRDIPGIVGAFCRIYSVERAIARYIPKVYAPYDPLRGKWSFTGGSSQGGASLLDAGLYLYSFHTSDPCAKRICNAFDMVRIHLFGDLDEGTQHTGTPDQYPSYQAFCEMLQTDEEVMQSMEDVRNARMMRSFSDVLPQQQWQDLISIIPSTGRPEKTTRNIIVILENDPAVKDKIAFDEFANRGVARGELPWNQGSACREWTDIDDKGLRDYVEYEYGISSPSKVDDALGLCAHNHAFNEVKDYLESLQWDQNPRIESLCIEYLGAADNSYNRAVMAKSLVAAVARIMSPGIKYDCVPILVGPQGIGKSTFLRMLGKQWFSDNLTSFEGKDASEMIQGVWLNELGELSTLNRSESNVAKQFISRCEDIYREPFGKRTKRYPRRCVFFGTSNESEFLKDHTGNRRFWPITLMVQNPTKSIFTDLEGEVDQIWAEAVIRWQQGEPLYLSGELEGIARGQQDLYRETNIKEGIVREFADKELPLDWDSRDLMHRRMFWNAEQPSGSDTMPRRRICAAEVWCECFGSDIRYITRKDSIEINAILAKLPGWKRYQGRFSIYNHQKGFERV